jgi:hypothetical protein
MKFTEEELIELARKAKPVPVKIDGADGKLQRKHSGDPVSLFLTETGLKPGKNKVELKEIYNAYVTWAKDPMNIKGFTKNLSPFFEKVKNGYIKTNMKPITLFEKIRELKKNEKEHEK